MQLAEDGEKFGGTAKARQDFPQSITIDSIKGLGRVYKSCIQTYVLFSAFLLYLPQHENYVWYTLPAFTGEALTFASFKREPSSFLSFQTETKLLTKVG